MEENTEKMPKAESGPEAVRKPASVQPLAGPGEGLFQDDLRGAPAAGDDAGFRKKKRRPAALAAATVGIVAVIGIGIWGYAGTPQPAQPTKHEQPVKQEQPAEAVPQPKEKPQSEQPAASAEQKPAPAAPPAQGAPAKPSMTTSQSSALKKAKSYLKTLGGFSHDGLVKQLVYEKFSNEDATYAVDNCGADWAEQAKEKAASYMKSIGGFSHDGLVEQLEYEGFTPDQAEQGASSVGL